MKKSQQIKLKASGSENDFEAFRLYGKAVREEREESFREKYQSMFEFEHGEHFFFDEKMKAFRLEKEHPTIQDKTIKVFDFYPKGGKVFDHARKKWISKGLEWIVNNFLP